MSAANTKVAVYGLELHYSGGSSDKYYRVFVIENVVVIHYGGRGTAGQVTMHPHRTQAGATAKAREMADAKEAKGYNITREFTSFPADPADLPTALVQAYRSPQAAPSVRLSGAEVSVLVRQFKTTAAEAGNTRPGADQ